jgi:glutamate-1-semialdehyde 2,1-aminomutase
MTITLPFNDLKAVKKAVERESNEIACIIVEPVPGNMGLILPEDGFLQGLRELCTRHGTVLIFDEVMSGFRVAYGGAQGLYNIKPDMTCLGKVIGGGLPVGAFGGKRDIMEKVAPVGPVYQAGTLSGNPLAVAAGIETLKILDTPGTYESIVKKTKELDEGLKDAARKAGVSVYTTSIGSEFCIFFSPGKVFDYTSAKKSDTNAFGKFFMAMLKQGIYLPPSQFETLFLSTAHTGEDIHKTIDAARRAFKEI